MIDLDNKKDCCGCSACACACPQKCISMVMDIEGFLYPEIDYKRCIHCGLCKKVCPISNLDTEKENNDQIGVIVANRNDEVLKQSTSGGAFTAIAEYVINSEGVVFGVEIDAAYHVHHIGVNSIEDLIKFRNSKYVQSDISNTYIKVKELLQENVMVCFSGTPCQVEGLRRYLGREYDNLILIDVVCRAVPSPGVWKSYISYLKEKYGDIKSIRFRDKSLGYQFSTMHILTDEKELRDGIESDPWLRLFFSGMIIRPSCTDCKFRTQYRKSDITIWDCFNVSDISDVFSETKGATRMLIHTEKGRTIFEKVKEKYIYEVIDVRTLTAGATELSRSPMENEKKPHFFEDYQRLPMQELLNKYVPMTPSVKIKKQARIILNKFGIDIYVKRIIRRMH